MSKSTAQNPMTEYTQMFQNLTTEQARQTKELILEPILTMQRQMNQMMMYAMESFTLLPQVLPASWGNILPEVDVWEDKDTFYLQTSIPGVDPKDLRISVTDDAMTITYGPEKISKQMEKRRMLNKHSCRTVVIPSIADSDKAEAQIKNDILLITLPKKTGAAEKNKKIPVKRVA